MHLPPEVLQQHVFPHLDLRHLTCAAGVCREWRQAVASSKAFEQAGFLGYARFHRLQRHMLCSCCSRARGYRHVLLRRYLCKACKVLPKNRLVCKGTAVALLAPCILERADSTRRAVATRLLLTVDCLLVS